MAEAGGANGSASAPATHEQVQALRESRWMGQGYADITKLRELSAKHERLSTKDQTRAARVHTRIERLRHTATLLREKAQRVLDQIPMIEQEMAQHERDIKSASERAPGGPVGSDLTGLHLRMRKLQQRIVDLQHKSRTLEHRAAQRTQKTAELKIKADRFLERAKIEQQEADAYRQRADRLQMATEGALAAPRPVAGPTPPAAHEVSDRA